MFSTASVVTAQDIPNTTDGVKIAFKTCKKKWTYLRTRMKNSYRLCRTRTKGLIQFGPFVTQSDIFQLVNKTNKCKVFHMGKWRYSSTIQDLDTRWRWEVSFTPQPLYHQGNCPRHPLNRKLGGPQNRSGRYGEDKNSCPCGESNPVSAAGTLSLYRPSYPGILFIIRSRSSVGIDVA
jgi:hypothetical protein